jgi:peptidoglycan/LPS O-acetylase OafA/YrhL
MKPPLPQTPSLGQSSNLDFLRSVAVLAVFADHLSATFGIAQRHDFLFRLGSWGVLLFFVHTSFVLMMSLERMRLEGWPMYGAFYLRRFARIYPLSTVTIALVLLAHIPESPWSATAFQMPGRAAVLFNFLLCGNLTLTQPVIGPLWSLPYEVQMYLLLPFIFVLLRRNPSWRALAFAWLISVALGSLQARLLAVPGLGMWRLGLAQFAPCFLSGIIAYFIARRLAGPRLPSWTWPCILCAATLTYLAQPRQPNLGPVSWIVCLGVGLGVAYFAEMNHRGFGTVTHYVAKYSYGLYLAQVPVLWFVFVRLRGSSSLLQWPLFIALIVLVPVLSYHLIEEPCIKSGSALAKRMFH